MRESVRFGQIRRVILFGGGEVLLRLAPALRGMGFEVQVVTAPRLAEERWGDGAAFDESVRQMGFPLWVTPELRAEAPPLNSVTRQTLGLSLGAAWIFQEPILRLFDERLLNNHSTWLPYDRGGGGFSWRILRGDRQGCCLVHRIDAGVDTGPVLDRSRFPFPRWCRIPRDFFEVQHQKDFSFLIAFFRKIMRGARFWAVAQDASRSAYWPRLHTALHGAIDWSWTAGEIERFVCAFDDPYPGAHTTWRNEEVRLKDGRRVSGDPLFHPFQAGLIYRMHEGRLFVACRGGNLSFGRVEGREGEDLLRLLRVGERLWTPQELLEEARTTRVFHSSRGPLIPSAVPSAAPVRSIQRVPG